MLASLRALSDASVSGRIECLKCGRPLVACYCAHVVSLDTRTRVLVLQHPREREKAIGTARIAALCLPNSEIVVGVDFSAHPRVQARFREWETAGQVQLVGTEECYLRIMGRLA